MTAKPETSPPRPRWVAFVPPPLAFMVTLAGMIALDRLAPGPLLWTWPVTLAGAAVMLVGLGIAVAAQIAFSRAGVSPALFRGGRQVVDTGPFRVSRNPMYLSLVVTTVGIAGWMGHLTPWLGPVALVLWLDRVFIPREEAVLAAHFGDAWTAYTARVRRWI
ncbi:methyltransferase family protein [Roseospira navarrensis]|uniref:Isoprenylcysteine carboxylmethyltransferase family protein n=1 Tax=Roseospira navarrensis TaxID=140058 RepID=A0A7X2D565_9PROT|nr:isoprenylcysteine carboxylmethyltransferase family protein [Roseospira navarrensis]MQX38571.1 hypothetical protein [Roseospira navarrensis]